MPSTTSQSTDIDIVIRQQDPRTPDVVALIKAHLSHSMAHSPPESVHALNLDALCTPEITFWAAWDEAAQAPVLAGFGALKELDPYHGEIKSMHTAAAYRGKGVASRLVAHMIAVAHTRAYRRLSLETGSMQAYIPARSLYRRHGFTQCPPFADYGPDPNSVFMTLLLNPSDRTASDDADHGHNQ